MSMVLMVCCLLAGNEAKIVVFHLLQRQKTFFFHRVRPHWHILNPFNNHVIGICNFKSENRNLYQSPINGFTHYPLYLILSHPNEFLISSGWNLIFFRKKLFFLPKRLFSYNKQRLSPDTENIQ